MANETNPIKLRGHHLSNFASDYFQGEYSIRDLIYPNSTEIFRAFKENPDIKVEIVEGLDSICEAEGVEECPLFEPDCVFRDPLWDEDNETLREYELQVGQVYCASDIIERFIDYKNKTGYKSPRNKFVAENWRLE